MSAARDLTPLPDLLHSTQQAGPARTRRPVYVNLLPPCNAACPAGENPNQVILPFFTLRVTEPGRAAHWPMPE